MYTFGYLLSGVGGISSGNAFRVGGMRDFSTSIFLTNTGGLTGSFSVDISGRIHPQAGWLNITSKTLTIDTGLLYQFTGPFSDVLACTRGNLSGTLTVSIRGETYK